MYDGFDGFYTAVSDWVLQNISGRDKWIVPRVKASSREHVLPSMHLERLLVSLKLEGVAHPAPKRECQKTVAKLWDMRTSVKAVLIISCSPKAPYT